MRGQLFDISTRSVSVRTHLPWPLRIFILVVIVFLLLAVAEWIFNFGRQIAGYDRERLSAVQAANAALEKETMRLRSLLSASENNLQIEKAAQKLLTEKYDLLMDENARLKEELAVLQRLTKTGKTTTSEAPRAVEKKESHHVRQEKQTQ